jgi:hypothetical protein
MGVPRFLMRSIQAIESMLGTRSDGPEALYLGRAQRSPEPS